MPTPASGPITFTDIANEMGFSQPYEMEDMYAIASTAGYNGLQYHNLNMGINNDKTAKSAIYEPGDASANMSTSNWYNYAQDVPLVINYEIINSSDYAVHIYITMWDSNDVQIDDIFQGTIGAKLTEGPTSMTTGITTHHNDLVSGYKIAVQDVYFNPPPPFAAAYLIDLDVLQTTDTDGVGADTSRSAYNLGGYTEMGPNIPLPPPNIPYTATMAIDCNGNPIPCNKRTLFRIEITNH